MGRILVNEARRDRVGGAVVAALAVAASIVALPSAGLCDPNAPREHAISLLGSVRYGPDFKHFDWVDPNAPKGGRVRMRATGTNDSLNPYAQKGLAAVWSNVIHDSLMAESLDEPATEYGLIAEWVAHAPDFSSATFGIRPEARFHDGRPITPDDVVFSLEALKKSSPRYQIYFKDVTRAVVSGERMVTFEFAVTGNRELPVIVGSLPVLARHYWEGKDANGEPRDIARGTTEIPLGSGPYRIKQADIGRSITYERVADWWARDLPVSRGQWNFDEVRFEYFRDAVPAFEAFKAGQLDFWSESSAKSWATAYDFDALRRGLVKREEWQNDLVTPMQGFAFNIRRPQFKDPRVRRAFNLAFDFEWASKNILFDQYTRVGSYFENSELKAKGLPTGRELELLESVREQVPKEVFTTPYANPFNRGPEDARRHMAEAAKLLAAAGWKQQNGELRNAAGEAFTVEFLIVSPEFERIIQPYGVALGRLGIKTSIRIVDSAQYRRRLNTFDFDMVVASFRQSVTPGNEQRDYWGSAAADSEGSRNLIGIKNTAVDQLIEKVIFATDRAELVAASRALDRVLLWNHYLVPQWYVPKERVAMWDMFGGPAKMPTHVQATSRFLQVWWHDQAAAARLSDARRR
ncbi:MAG: ABC transporter substrate-binding protein [Hyphomicrobium sp.]|nr:ABC transporter substrate-binding protein [Hyphomicrobium sp.]